MDIRKKIIRALEEKKFKEKYYKCPNCGDITTESEILDECGNGGCGMCYCEFNNGRILNKWKRISKKEYFKLKEVKKEPDFELEEARHNEEAETSRQNFYESWEENLNGNL